MTWRGRPKTARISSAVTTVDGAPWATTQPSDITIRWVAPRQAWLMSCSTIATVR